jgi:methyltransferase (TIGR00027 family)
MTSDWSITSGPGITALGLAAARSVESARSDRLIEDPFARTLFCSAGSGLAMLVEWPSPDRPLSDTEKLHLHGSRYIGLRTRVYDDILLAASGAGLRQAVLLGAGLDTRAFRLELPGDLQLYELDQAGVLSYKDKMFSRNGARPRCARAAIASDLRDDLAGALRARGFDAKRPTMWIAEGVLPYLAPGEQAHLLRQVHELAAVGSELAFDTIVGDPVGDGRLRTLSQRAGIDMEALMARGEAPPLASLLSQWGWNVEEQTTAELARRYSRDLSDPFSRTAGDDEAEPPWLNTTFTCAARR